MNNNESGTMEKGGTGAREVHLWGGDKNQEPYIEELIQETPVRRDDPWGKEKKGGRKYLNREK